MTTPMRREQVEKVSWNLGSYIGCPESMVKALLDDNDALRQRVEELEHITKQLATHEVCSERDALIARLTEVERERDKLGNMLNSRDLKCDEGRCGAQAEVNTLTRKNERLRRVLQALMERAKAQWDHAADFAGDPPSKCTDPLYLQAQAALKETP